MIDAARLLADLKRLRRGLDADLRQAHAAGAGRAAVEAEWRAAREAGRTAETFETFFDAALDQTGMHWVLACVFLRFLEDNGLVERPVLGAPVSGSIWPGSGMRPISASTLTLPTSITCSTPSPRWC